MFCCFVRDYQKNSYIDSKRREPLDSLRFCFAQRRTLTENIEKDLKSEDFRSWWR